MNIYFDNAATTSCSRKVADAMMKILTEDYGNPSSLHNMGMDAEKYLIEAREKIANILRVDTSEIIFTSGGTESNNIAIVGAAHAKRRVGTHIVTTKIEHPSVHGPASILEDEGYHITYLSVDKNGRVDLDELKRSIRDDTTLVSIMHVNNEIGTFQDIEEASKIIKFINPYIMFHVDATQSFSKVRINPSRIGVDLLTASSHKVHGPKGAGVLYVAKNARVTPVMKGGSQEQDVRSGTENVPAIYGMALAAEEEYECRKDNFKLVGDIKQRILEGVADIEGVEPVIDNSNEVSPYILSLCIKNVKAEVMLHALEAEGIYVSSGSACSSNKVRQSYVLESIGVKGDCMDDTIRLSFGSTNTLDETDVFVKTLAKLVPTLSSFVRR